MSSRTLIFSIHIQSMMDEYDYFILRMIRESNEKGLTFFHSTSIRLIGMSHRHKRQKTRPALVDRTFRISLPPALSFPI